MPAQFPIIFGIAAIVLIAGIATLVALYAWMTSPTKVLSEIEALDLDATTKAALKSCCGGGYRAVAETQAGLKCAVPGPRPLQET